MLLLLMGLMSTSGERMRETVPAIGDELTKTTLSSGSGWGDRYGFAREEGTFTSTRGAAPAPRAGRRPPSDSRDVRLRPPAMSGAGKASPASR